MAKGKGSQRQLPVGYSKRNDGSWGVRITGKRAKGINVGDRFTIDVEKMDGTTRREKVVATWKGDNLYGSGKVVLCRIEGREDGGKKKGGKKKAGGKGGGKKKKKSQQPAAWDRPASGVRTDGDDPVDVPF